MKRVLVVVYSCTGNSRLVAQRLADDMAWPVAEIRELHARAGASGMLRCVLDSLLARRPPIEYDGPPVGEFALVVLVAPIWMSRLAGPMRSFVAERERSLPAVAVVNTMNSGGAVNAVAEIAHLLHRPPVEAIAFTASEIEQERMDVRLREFGNALAASVEGRPLPSRTAVPETA